MLPDRLRDSASGRSVLGNVPAPCRFNQCPGDQEVSVGRIIDVLDLWVRVRIPSPSIKTVFTNGQSLCPLPQALKSCSVVLPRRKQHRIALALAVTDPSVCIVKHPTFGGNEVRAITPPTAGERV